MTENTITTADTVSAKERTADEIAAAEIARLAPAVADAWKEAVELRTQLDSNPPDTDEEAVEPLAKLWALEDYVCRAPLVTVADALARLGCVALLFERGPQTSGIDGEALASATAWLEANVAGPLITRTLGVPLDTTNWLILRAEAEIAFAVYEACAPLQDDAYEDLAVLPADGFSIASDAADEAARRWLEHPVTDLYQAKYKAQFFVQHPHLLDADEVVKHLSADLDRLENAQWEAR